MVPKDVATTLVAALLATICPVAGAPVLPGDGSNFLYRSIDSLGRVMESRPARNNAAVYQPHPPVNADHYAHFQAEPDAHATPHSYAGMSMWAQDPPSSYPNQLYDSTRSSGSESPPYPSQSDIDDVIALLHDSPQHGQVPSHPMPPNPLRFTSTEAAPRQPFGGLSGFFPGSFQGHFDDNHMAGTHQSTGAQGSLLPIASTSLHQPAGPSGLPGEASANQARPLRERPSLSEEEKKRSKKESNRVTYLREKQPESWVGTNRPAIAQGGIGSQAANHFLDVNEKNLLDRATPLFTIGQMAPQIPFNVFSPRHHEERMEDYVWSTENQARVVQEILLRRLRKFKRPKDSIPGLHLESELDPIPLRKDILSLLGTVKRKGTGRLGPFEKPGPRDRSNQPYLHEFMLGDYLIYVHYPNPSGLRKVIAYPMVKLDNDQRGSKQGNPMTIFLGSLRIEKSRPPTHSNVADTITR